MSRPVTPRSTSNGTHTPQTPSLSSFALTEYVTGHSPTPGTPNAKTTAVPPSDLLPNGYPDYMRLILTSRVYEVLERTPLTPLTNLSNRLESQVMLKREDLLPVFSFKLRGAYNKMAHLTSEVRWKGVVACSAGNHAQGVAYSARKLKIPATIVMPQATPEIKHRNVARLGGIVKLHGPDFDAAKEEAHRLEKVHGLTNIPPFDDPYVIAGQGTIGMELLQQTDLQQLEAIFCCVGGGGLIAGIGVYIKRIIPHVKVIGVETYDANAMVTSLTEGKRVVLKDVGLFADGAAVKTVGEETFRLCRDVVDEIIQVTTDEACAAIKDVFEDTRSILEPAGALSLAGLKKYVAAHPSVNPNRQLVALASGANMNFDRLRFVAERANLGEQREALLSVRIPEEPGSFAKLIQTLSPLNCTEFCYRYYHSGAAHVLVGVTLDPNRRHADLRDALARLQAAHMPATDCSTDEVAKSHIRYLVGGRLGSADTAPKETTAPATNGDITEPATTNTGTRAEERLYAFEFPERPGALSRFLTALQPGFNISLFHYRNYGGDVARVLAGIQCPTGQEKQLERFLRTVGYPYKEETENEVYRTFLRA